MNEEIVKIHNASMKILNEIGMEFNDEYILNILREHNIKIDGNRAYFTEDDILKYIDLAPREFTLYARNEDSNMNINIDSIYYVPGYGAPKIREYDGKLRDAKLDDYIKFTKLVQSSEYFKINGGILVQPYDIDTKLSQAIMTYITITKSDKCIMGIPGSKENFKQIIELVKILAGGEQQLKSKPRLITLISTLSPLKIDDNMMECLKICCEYNQPMVITPGPMAGATGPISLAGNIAMGNAETLATIAVAQMIKPGVPVVYGHVCTTSNLRTGNVSIGSPGFAVQGKYGARLAKYYNLPNRTLGTESDANGITVQSGYEAMMSMFAAHNEKSNFIIHSAGILDSFSSMSYEKFISDLEVISMVEYYFKSLEINDKTLAIDVIKDVVSKGTFMTHKHTAKRCRKDPWDPSISIVGKLKLSDTPSNLIKELIDNNIKKLLDKYETIELSDDISKELRDYMISIGVDESILSKIDENK